MSSQITLNTWSGRSKKEAAAELSKVFRMDLQKGLAVIENLCQGLPWRFNYTISSHDATLASKYLREIGFSVDIQSVKNCVEPLPQSKSLENNETETPPLPSNEYFHRMSFKGDGSTLFGISLINLAKTILTMGLYRFWAKTNVRQYLWSQTFFAGDRFSYHGNAKELLQGFTRFGLIFILLIVLNTYAYFQVGVDEGEMVGNLLAVIFLISIPFLMVGACGYRLSRSAWRDIRFSFRGQGEEALYIYIKGYLLVTITLGLYWPFFKMEREKFWRENSWFGDIQFHFSGKGKEFFKKFVIALFLTPLTLGFYLFWFSADLNRYVWSNTHIAGAKFHFPIKGRDYFNLKILNFFLIVLTLGLANSWVVVRNRNFIANHLTFTGNIELNRIVKEIKGSGAFGEESMEIMDVPSDAM